MARETCPFSVFVKGVLLDIYGHGQRTRLTIGFVCRVRIE